MQSALQLTKRGHKVTLYEKCSTLGGLLNTTDGIKFKWGVNKYKNWMAEKVMKNPDIQVYLNTSVTRDMLRKEKFDAVVIGIGASANIPRIKGIERAESCVDMFGAQDKVDKDVVIIGGGEVGVDAGMLLAETGHNVMIIEATGMLAATSNIMHTYSHIRKYWEALPTFKYSLDSKVIEITKDSVIYIDSEGNQNEIKCGTVLYAVGMSAKKQEMLELIDASEYDSYIIGDCGDYGGDIQRCNRSALGAAQRI